MMGPAKNMDRINRIRALAAEGLSQTVIADHMGVSRERIRQICIREGIETMSGRVDWDALDAVLAAADAGMTLRQTCAHTGLPHSHVRSLSRRRSIKFREPDRKWHKLRDLASQGLSLSQCAREMGVTPQHVWSEAKRKGIVFAANEPRQKVRIEIDGVQYASRSKAARAHGVTPRAIVYWEKTGKAVRL